MKLVSHARDRSAVVLHLPGQFAIDLVMDELHVRNLAREELAELLDRSVFDEAIADE